MNFGINQMANDTEIDLSSDVEDDTFMKFYQKKFIFLM